MPQVFHQIWFTPDLVKAPQCLMPTASHQRITARLNVLVFKHDGILDEIANLH